MSKHRTQLIVSLLAVMTALSAGSRCVWRASNGRGNEDDAPACRVRRRAHDLWEAYGCPERMGYHIRGGRHKLLPFDWNHYMDFADKYMK